MLDLDAIKKRFDALSRDNWHLRNTENLAEAGRQYVPALIAEVERLREALRWMVNVQCGVGKDGLFPSVEEQEASTKAGQAALTPTENHEPE